MPTVSRADIEKFEEARVAVEKHGSITAAARALGVPRGTLSHRYHRASELDVETVPELKEQFNADESDDSLALASTSSNRRTVQDVLDFAGVDTDVWEVERHVVNSWDMGAKIGEGDSARIETQTMWQVKVWLRRKVPKRVEEALEHLSDRLVKYKPLKIVKRKPRRDGHLLVMSLFDAHFGKLAWEGETGVNYDLEIAEQVYRSAADDLLNRIDYKIDEVLLPIGQDFFHIDNWRNTTTKGTPVDTDSRWPKIFSSGAMAITHVVEQLRQIAPVRLTYVPGNHDMQSSWYLCYALSKQYDSCKYITVDVSPQQRKYHEYGAVMLGMTHGNEEPHRDLPAIMASEQPEMWSRTRYREWLLGHLHKRKQTWFVSTDTFIGTLVRILPSLSGMDAWHYLKGYVNSIRAADALLYHRDDGCVAQLTVNTRVAV